MANTLIAARSARFPAAAEHRRNSAGASTSCRGVPKPEHITGSGPNARLRRCHQQNGAARRQIPTARTRTRTAAAAAVEFADNSHIAFYEEQQPNLALDMGMKHARKLAKKIGKQKKSLTKLASAIQLSSSALQPVLAELDAALEQVQERVAQLEKEAGIDSDSSSDSSDDERTMDKQDETDAALIAGRLEERRNAREETAACASAVVGAMSVEARPAAPEGRFFVCQGKACKKRGGDAVLEAVSSRAAMLGDSVQVTPTGCLGQCKKGSCLRVKSGKNKPEFISRIGDEHVDDIFEYAFNVRPSEYMNY